MQFIFLDADEPQHPLHLNLGQEYEIVRSTVTRTTKGIGPVGLDPHTTIHFVRRVERGSVPHRVLLDESGTVARVFANSSEADADRIIKAAEAAESVAQANTRAFLEELPHPPEAIIAALNDLEGPT